MSELLATNTRLTQLQFCKENPLQWGWGTCRLELNQRRGLYNHSEAVSVRNLRRIKMGFYGPAFVDQTPNVAIKVLIPINVFE